MSTLSKHRFHIVMPNMDVFRAYPSRWRIALLLAFSLGAVGLGMWLTGMIGNTDFSDCEGRRRCYSPEFYPIVGWANISFFGLCAVVYVKRLFSKEVQVQIDRDGILFVQWSDKTIPWSEIENVSVWGAYGTKEIVLHLVNPNLFPGRGIRGLLAPINRKLAGGDVCITLTGTDRSFSEAMSAIKIFEADAPPVSSQR